MKKPTLLMGCLGYIFVIKSGLFFGHQRKNSRRNNSKLKEKTQNSRTKLKFSAFKSGEIEVNIGMKCFFTSTFKGKTMENIKKAQLIFKI